MASSGSYNMASGYGTIRVEWWVVSQNIGANTTRLGWRAVATWSSGSWIQVYACRIWINGAQVLNRGSAQTWGGQFASGELDIGHNGDGSKAFGTNGEAAIYTAAINASGSGSWDLPAIPRQANITGANNFNDEQNPSFTYSNPAGNSVTTLQAGIWKTNGIDSLFGGYVNVSKTGSSFTFVLTPEQRTLLRQWLANSTSMTVRYYLRTVIGGNDFRPYVERTVTIVNGNPVFSEFSHKDSNAATVAITGNDQYLIQGQSTLQATILAADKMQPQKEATAIRYRYQIGSIDTTQSYSTSDVVKELGVVGVNSPSPLIITAVDSRGLTVAATKTVEVLPYVAPQLNPIVERVNNFETSTKVKVTGVISRLTIAGTDKNTVNTTNGLQYRYKKTDTGTWGAWQNIASTTSGGNVSMTDFYVNLDRNFAWNVEFRLIDRITTTSVALIVSVGIPIFRIGADGKVYNNEVPLLVDGDGVIEAHNISFTQESTTETPVGKWIDGKVIYKKTVSFNTGTGVNYNYTHGVDVDTPIKVEANFGTNTLPIITPSDISFGEAVFLSKTAVSYRRGSSAPTNRDVKAVMYYTKV